MNQPKPFDCSSTLVTKHNAVLYPLPSAHALPPAKAITPLPPPPPAPPGPSPSLLSSPLQEAAPTSSDPRIIPTEDEASVYPVCIKRDTFGYEHAHVGKHCFPLFSHPLFRAQVADNEEVLQRVEAVLQQETHLQQFIEEITNFLIWKGAEGGVGVEAIEMLIGAHLDELENALPYNEIDYALRNMFTRPSFASSSHNDGVASPSGLQSTTIPFLPASENNRVVCDPLSDEKRFGRNVQTGRTDSTQRSDSVSSAPTATVSYSTDPSTLLTTSGEVKTISGSSPTTQSTVDSLQVVKVLTNGITEKRRVRKGEAVPVKGLGEEDALVGLTLHKVEKKEPARAEEGFVDTSSVSGSRLPLSEDVSGIEASQLDSVSVDSITLPPSKSKPSGSILKAKRPPSSPRASTPKGLAPISPSPLTKHGQSNAVALNRTTNTDTSQQKGSGGHGSPSARLDPTSSLHRASFSPFISCSERPCAATSTSAARVHSGRSSPCTVLSSSSASQQKPSRGRALPTAPTKLRYIPIIPGLEPSGFSLKAFLAPSSPASNAKKKKFSESLSLSPFSSSASAFHRASTGQEGLSPAGPPQRLRAPLPPPPERVVGSSEKLPAHLRRPFPISRTTWRRALRAAVYSLLHFKLEQQERLADGTPLPPPAPFHVRLEGNRQQLHRLQSVDADMFAQMPSRAFAVLDVSMDGNSKPLRMRRKASVNSMAAQLPTQISKHMLYEKHRRTGLGYDSLAYPPGLFPSAPPPPPPPTHTYSTRGEGQHPRLTALHQVARQFIRHPWSSKAVADSFSSFKVGTDETTTLPQCVDWENELIDEGTHDKRFSSSSLGAERVRAAHSRGEVSSRYISGARLSAQSNQLMGPMNKAVAKLPFSSQRAITEDDTSTLEHYGVWSLRNPLLNKVKLRISEQTFR